MSVMVRSLVQRRKKEGKQEIEYGKNVIYYHNNVVQGKEKWQQTQAGNKRKKGEMNTIGSEKGKGNQMNELWVDLKADKTGQ